MNTRCNVYEGQSRTHSACQVKNDHTQLTLHNSTHCACAALIDLKRDTRAQFLRGNCLAIIQAKPWLHGARKVRIIWYASRFPLAQKERRNKCGLCVWNSRAHERSEHSSWVFHLMDRANSVPNAFVDVQIGGTLQTKVIRVALLPSWGLSRCCMAEQTLSHVRYSMNIWQVKTRRLAVNVPLCGKFE